LLRTWPENSAAGPAPLQQLRVVVPMGAGALDQQAGASAGPTAASGASVSTKTCANDEKP
jgi:hypothetical protein